MVAAATTRVRPVIPTPPPAGPVVQPRRPTAAMVAVGIAVLMVGTFLWQVGSPYLRNEAVVRGATAVGRVSLESDPIGSRIDVVLVDRVGEQTTVTGTVDVSLREPDGTLWKTSRSITPADFQPLPDGGLLAGRVGYAVYVPASDWARPPRQGGAATVSVTVRPADAEAFSAQAQERFP